MEEDKEVGDKTLNAAIRSAKKAARPAKIGVPERKDSKSPKKRKVSVRPGNTFDSDFGQKSKSRGEGVRSKKGDAVRLGKTGGKKTKGRRK